MPSIWYVYDGDHETHYQYFDDLSGMLLALNAGTIDEITLPRFAAEYVAAKNPDLEICCVQSMPFEMSLVFGFRNDEGGRDLHAHRGRFSVLGFCSLSTQTPMPQVAQMMNDPLSKPSGL